MTTKKKAFFFILTALFLFGNVALANTITLQSGQSVSDSGSNGGAFDARSAVVLFNGYQGTVTDVSVFGYIGRNNFYSNSRFYTDTGATSSLFSYYTVDSDPTHLNVETNTAGLHLLTFHLETPILLNGASMAVFGSGGGPPGFDIYGSTSGITALHFGGLQVPWQPPYSTQYNSAVAPFLQLTGYGGDFVPPPPSLTFITPSQATTTSDFPRWLVYLDNLTTSTAYSVKIDYFSPSVGYNYYSDPATGTAYIDPGVVSRYFYIPKSTILTGAFSTADWVATATLSVAGGETLATTTAIFSIFSQSYTASGTYDVPFPTGTSTIIATCDAADGFFASSICNVLVWLFSPSRSALNQFALLQETFKNKPPLGYLSAFQSALSGLKAGSSTETLVSTTTFSALAPVLTPFRAGISWLLWFLFVFWAIGRFRHFNP